MTINVLPEPRTLASASAFARMLPGLALSGALAATGIALGRIAWLQDHGFSALTLAIVLGMIVGNTVYPWAPRLAVASGAGVNFSKQNLLRTSWIYHGRFSCFSPQIGRFSQHGIHGAVMSSRSCWPSS